MCRGLLAPWGWKMIKKITKSDSIIVTTSRINKLLVLVDANPGNEYKVLENLIKKRGIASGGSASDLVRSARKMQTLVNKGTEIHLSPLGKKMVSKPDDRELWKKACLNVPLYKEYYSLFPNDDEPENFIRWLIVEKKVRTREVTRMVRKYFEIVHEAHLPALKIPNDLEKLMEPNKPDVTSETSLRMKKVKFDTKSTKTISERDGGSYVNFIESYKELRKTCPVEEVRRLMDVLEK